MWEKGEPGERRIIEIAGPAQDWYEGQWQYYDLERIWGVHFQSTSGVNFILMSENPEECRPEPVSGIVLLENRPHPSPQDRTDRNTVYWVVIPFEKQ